MGKAIVGAAVSLDGFIADDNDGVGPLFDWLGNGWSFPGSDDEAAAPRPRPTSCGATTATWLRLENPTTIVRGDRVTHLVYDVSR